MRLNDSLGCPHNQQSHFAHLSEETELDKKKDNYEDVNIRLLTEEDYDRIIYYTDGRID